MKKIILYLMILTLVMTTLAGCTTQQNPTQAAVEPTTAPTATEKETEKIEEAKVPKYIFMLIGDGMSFAQVNAAQVYMGNNESGKVATKNMNFTEFPVAGVATTHDSTSFCPDSASTATSLSTGVKTHSGVIGMAVDKATSVQNISELLKEQKNMKIGVVSSVTINHATPAAYYAHVASRNDYYGIALQLAASGFDYFGGGNISKPTGNEKDQKDAYEIIKEAGYLIPETKEEILALNSQSGKVYASSPVVQDSGALLYALDNKEGELDFSDYVQNAINVLDNPDGFFIMAESGKIDWACHANDAKTTIEEVIEFENGVQVAIDFAKKHPDETLIIVTGDHETGGMTLGYAATGYSTAFNILDHQKMSYVAFDGLIKKMKEENSGLTFEDVMPIITENFGLLPPDEQVADNPLALTESEFQKLKDGFAESQKPKEERNYTDEQKILYGGYDPLSVSVTHIINNKAGIGWTSYSHTGTPVAVYASGVGAELFNGSYDNTDVFNKLLVATGLAN